ncbi:hypothetical protein [Bacillus toyonensis]|uniref:hypothetical protein n=1 Tax=Bacillus toyonensis TaxID=155322 RepID=UPI000BF836FB|nr:hypothetical protein [Bacillus toyonensis]PGF05321.1 hypothetical protein COM61_02605 [Bacillus toyonensis]
MNISKLKPIQLDSAEQFQAVENAVKTQSISTSVPRVFDENFPIFRFEANNKHLVYVPNFFETDEDGNKQLIREVAYVHSVTNGRAFSQYRSTQGLKGLEEYGISGNSPLMTATQECWELYNIKYKKVAEQLGVDPNDDKGEVLKPKRIELLNQRAIKDPDLKYYFPIVVFETEKDAKTGLNSFEWITHEVEGVGKIPKYKIFWMEVSENSWKNIWAKLADSMDTGDCVAGKLLSLNYNFTDDPSKEKNLRRDSGKNLQINIRQIKPQDVEFFGYLDKQAEEWTKQKARDTIIACALLTDEQQQEIVDEAMAETRLELNMLKNVQAGLTGGATQQIETKQNQSPEELLGGFGGAINETKTEESQAETSGAEGITFGAE